MPARAGLGGGGISLPCLAPEGSLLPEYTIRRNGDLTEITLYGAGLYTVPASGT